MDDNKVLSIPYVVHEGDMARLERTNKRLWILCLVILVALVGSNCCWIWYESQWEDVETTTTQEVSQDVDTGNGSAYVAGIGNIYGEGETDG